MVAQAVAVSSRALGGCGCASLEQASKENLNLKIDFPLEARYLNDRDCVCGFGRSPKVRLRSLWWFLTKFESKLI